jgi:hypothetical protein
LNLGLVIVSRPLGKKKLWTNGLSFVVEDIAWNPYEFFDVDVCYPIESCVTVYLTRRVCA